MNTRRRELRPEIVTVAILHRVDMAEHYVGVIQGGVSEAKRREFAKRFDAVYVRDIGQPDADDMIDDDEVDEMYFREIRPVTSIDKLVDMPNIDDKAHYTKDVGA